MKPEEINPVFLEETLKKYNLKKIKKLKPVKEPKIELPKEEPEPIIEPEEPKSRWTTYVKGYNEFR